MKKQIIVNPISLKGYEITERMKELMGKMTINENTDKGNSVVELTKVGPDGKVYGIVRENHEYYIKTTNKTSNLVTEDFNYIGGLQNKKDKAYPSYAKAIKHLNLEFKSLAEAYGQGGDINLFENDNLMTENLGVGIASAGFTNEGNLEENTPLYEEEIEDDNEELSLEEQAIDDMIAEEEQFSYNTTYKGDPNQLPDPAPELYIPETEIDPISGNNGDLMSQLDEIPLGELTSGLASDIKAKIIELINTGADKARNYLSNRYDESDALYEDVKKKV